MIKQHATNHSPHAPMTPATTQLPACPVVSLDLVQLNLVAESLQTGFLGFDGNPLDAWKELIRAIRCTGDAISAPAFPGHDETGGTVTCLTEAVMGITAGLVRISESIDRLAEAVEAGKEASP